MNFRPTWATWQDTKTKQRNIKKPGLGGVIGVGTALVLEPRAGGVVRDSCCETLEEIALKRTPLWIFASEEKIFPAFLDLRMGLAVPLNPTVEHPPLLQVAPSPLATPSAIWLREGHRMTASGVSQDLAL